MKVQHFLLPFLAISIVFQHANYAQSSDLSAAEIFDKVVQYYDPDGVWPTFEGSMHIHTISKRIGEEDLTINNATGFYQSTRHLPEGVYTKGTRNGTVFFEDNGKEMSEQEVPEFLKKKYGFKEMGVRKMKEHHIGHFSLPLAMKAAGAEPNKEVGKKTLFGAECLMITFNEWPNTMEKGFYHGYPITFYVDPAKDFRLHAYHFDSGMWTDKKGGIALLKGELEVGGIKIPARKLYFDAANHNFRLMDAFTAETGQ